MQHQTPAPSITRDPLWVRRSARFAHAAAVISAVVGIGSAVAGVMTDGVWFDVVSVVGVAAAIWFFGRGTYLYGWVAGRADAGRALDRVADQARNLPADQVEAYRSAAVIAAGGER